jgi:hypothetical protein
MIWFELDPFAMVVQVVHDLYPEAIAVVRWCNGLHEQHGAWGCTEFDVPNGPLISLDVAMPVLGAVEVLAHELAHVVAGPEAEHGAEWESAFAAIHREYCRRVESL